MNNDSLYSFKLPYTIIVDSFYSLPSLGKIRKNFIFRHVAFIILQLIDNYSITEIIGKKHFIF